MIRTALMMLLACALPAQVVRLANHNAHPFEGWARTTIDVLPPHAAGELEGARYVVGRQVGLSTWTVDIHTTLEPNEERSIDLGRGRASKWKLGPAVGFDFFGGLPAVNGVTLQPVSVVADGAGALIHFRARLPGLWHVDLWALWRPDEPGFVTGEVVCCASNPGTPAVLEPTPAAAPIAIPPRALQLTWGDGRVHVPGAGDGWDAPIVPPSTFATGQARATPFTILWLRNVKGEWLAAHAAKERSVCGVGVASLLPDGNPTLPPGFSGRNWTTSLYSESLRRLHGFEPPLSGPNPSSGDTGAQEDQTFVGGEVFAKDGAGCEQVRYLNALRIISRPCHHLEVDGGIVDPTTAEPRLVYWDGQPHWHTGVSPNRLGKERGVTAHECNGWIGPDVEHWLMNQTAAAARLTGSPALQWELRNQAFVYLGQWTTTPGWSTSQPYAARAVGWEGINAVHMWTSLEDRAVAERVRSHWQRRCVDVILPAWRDKDFVDVRVDDPRLGAGAWWMPWQAAVGAYGLDLACTEIGPVEGRAVALRVAKAVLRDAWKLSGGRWATAPIAPVPTADFTMLAPSAALDIARAREWVHEDTGVPRMLSVAASTTMFDESFNYFGMAMAVAVVLRHEPHNERAIAIWKQLCEGALEAGQTRWLAPGLVSW